MPSKRSNSGYLADLAPDETTSRVDQYAELHDAGSDRKKERYESLVTMPRALDRMAGFREIFRVLRPGACFAGYDWRVTEDLDPGDPEHVRIVLLPGPQTSMMSRAVSPDRCGAAASQMSMDVVVLEGEVLHRTADPRGVTPCTPGGCPPTPPPPPPAPLSAVLDMRLCRDGAWVTETVEPRR